MRRITPDQVNDFARMMGGDRNDPASVRRRIEALEAVLERAFIVPGINRPIGLDAIVGLIPVVGDLLAALMSAYVIWEARNLGMSKWRSEEHTSELQSLMRISYAVFCLKKKKYSSTLQQVQTT